MSKHEEAELILKLYDLRREPVMRQAREWFTREFNPETIADVHAAMFGEHSGHLRMVMSYWDMAAALVNHGAIGAELFLETNGEHIFVFAKLEPVLQEMRAAYGPQFLANVEKVILGDEKARARLAHVRERIKLMRAELAKRQQTAGQR
jgi:hypothetical protein